MCINNKSKSILVINPPDEYELFNEYDIKPKKKAKKKKKYQMPKGYRKICKSTINVSNDKNDSDDFVIPLLNNQEHIREGNDIPAYMILNKQQDSGFHFGIKNGLVNTYIGKPQNCDGHILIVGGPGSGKTTGLITPTLYTWKGHIVLVDVKPESDLLVQCQKASKLKNKRIFIFNPINGDCSYDLFSYPKLDGI
jgi:hypothetical protein